MAALNSRYAGMSNEQMKEVSVAASDQLGKWAIDYLLNTDDKDLAAMLEAAIKQTYSASPAEQFFTGGGVHKFSNYDNKYDHKIISVNEAFHNSVNLILSHNAGYR